MNAPLHIFASTPLPEGVPQVLDRLQQTPGVVHIAVMPDVHLASEFCVGTVVASDAFIFPNAVGGDIGCGMLALPLSADPDIFQDRDLAARLLALLQSACPDRHHHRKTAPPLPENLLREQLSHPHLEQYKRSVESQMQLGTLGAGNHFLEFQSDQDGKLWLMIHTGSRHLGQRILHHHLPRAMRLDTGIFALAADFPEAAEYLNDVRIARAWAAQNRRHLAEAAVKALNHLTLIRALAAPTDVDHNHVQLELHSGRPLLIHRKGATPSHLNAPGIIPGSMGTRSFHTLGKGRPDSLCSSSHGAGRALSRTQARTQITSASLRQQLHKIWYDARLEKTLKEEAPAAYKDIDKVMQAQSDLTQITRTLTPLLVYKST